MKRTKRTPRNSFRWKPIVKGNTQEGAASYDAGVIWKPILQDNSHKQNISTLDPEMIQHVGNPGQPQGEPKTNEHPAVPPSGPNIKKEEVRDERSLSVPWGTKYKQTNITKPGKFISLVPKMKQNR